MKIYKYELKLVFQDPQSVIVPLDSVPLSFKIVGNAPVVYFMICDDYDDKTDTYDFYLFPTGDSGGISCIEDSNRFVGTDSLNGIIIHCFCNITYTKKGLR